MVHELLKSEDTETELRKNYKQVGEHLYVNPKQKLKIGGAPKEKLKEYQVVFLMGGGGTRLIHVTGDKIPKHMIKVNEKPMSQYVYDMWRESGFNNFCFLIDNTVKGDVVREHYGDGSKFGVEHGYSVETKKMGSGGAMKLAIDNRIITQQFVNHYPDDQIIGYKNFPLDFVKVCEGARKAGYDTVIVCVPGTAYQYGEVVDEDGEVVDFVEKPFVKKDSNIGVFWINRNVFDLFNEIDATKAEVKVERTVLKKLARSRKVLKVLLPSEYWVPINDDPGLKKFEEMIKTRAEAGVP